MHVPLPARLLAAAITMASASVAQRNAYPGRVLDADGRAVAGAIVTARWRGAPELPDLVGWSLGVAEDLGTTSAEVRADDGGRFVFDLPVRGPVALLARDTDGTRLSPRRFPVLAGDVSELHLRPAVFVAGRITAADGTPLADTELVLEPERRAWVRRATSACPTRRVRLRTDADGHFRQAIEHAWAEAPMWEPLVVLRPADDALGFAEEILVQPLPEFAELDLVATPRALWRGSLRDVAGVPLPGGRIYEQNAPWRTMLAGAAGAFAMPATHVSELAFAATGYSSAAIPYKNGEVQLPEDHGMGLLLCRRATMRLVDDQQQPLPDCEVLWSCRSKGEPPREWLARTDASGRIELEGSVLTTTSGFTKSDGLWRRFLRTQIARDEDLGDVAVTSRSLDGQVLDAQGQPCAGARVIAMEVDPRTPTLPPRWVTYCDHGGRFRFPSLPPTAFTMLVEAGMRGCGQANVTADAAQCTLQLAPGKVVEVVVRDAAGAVPGCWVALTRGHGLPDPELVRLRDELDSVFGRTDERGVARFEGLPDTEWIAIAECWREGQREAGGSDTHDHEAVTIQLRTYRR